MTPILKLLRLKYPSAAGLLAACLLATCPVAADAAPAGSGMQFSISIGPRPSGYSALGYGRYGHGRNLRYSYGRSRVGALPLYGNGPYGYGHSRYSDYSGRTYMNNAWSPYNSSYYSPYSGWAYAPYGVPLNTPYGY
jgi:hypothetical protein